ncbi:MAG: hypothetical protein AABY89_02340 [Acidobacteriota bacterium]
MTYEQWKMAPATRARFILRLVTHGAWAALLLVFSLGIGMAGYVHFEGLNWVDAFLNASMLLGGMGPVDRPLTQGGKLFAGGYALYSGLVVLVGFAIIMAPAIHRLLHYFHLEGEAEGWK